MGRLPNLGALALFRRFVPTAADAQPPAPEDSDSDSEFPPLKDGVVDPEGYEIAKQLQRVTAKIERLEMSDEEWAVIEAKRKQQVEHAKNSPAVGYAKYRKVVPHGQGQAQITYGRRTVTQTVPGTPDHTNRQLSKREWDKKMTRWRTYLKEHKDRWESDQYS